jgi:glycosyltransferase involved in cell wall biosynthesis
LVNLVFICRGDPVLSTGGTEIFTGNLAAELAKNGVAVNVIYAFEGSHVFLPKTENLVFRGLHLIRIPYLRAIDYQRKCATYCTKLLGESKVDAVVAFGAGVFPNYIFKQIRKSNLSVPLFFYAMDSMKMEFERGKKSSEVTSLFSKFKRWLWYRALIKSDKASCLTSDLIIASSKDTINHLIDDYSVSSDKIRLLYEGIPDEFSAGFDVSDPVVPTFLHVGGYPRKGTDVFLKAMKMLEEKYDLKAKTVIVRVSQSNIEQAKKLRVEITAYKRLTIPELKRQYASCTAFVSPSLSEGFCLPIIEAEMFGKPSIVTNVGSLPELVTDNENGFVVPVADATALADKLYRIAVDSNLRKKMGDSAKSRSTVFTIKKTASNLLALIENHSV